MGPGLRVHPHGFIPRHSLAVPGMEQLGMGDRMISFAIDLNLAYDLLYRVIAHIGSLINQYITALPKPSDST